MPLNKIDKYCTYCSSTKVKHSDVCIGGPVKYSIFSQAEKCQIGRNCFPHYHLKCGNCLNYSFIFEKPYRLSSAMDTWLYDDLLDKINLKIDGELTNGRIHDMNGIYVGAAKEMIKQFPDSFSEMFRKLIEKNHGT